MRSIVTYKQTYNKPSREDCEESILLRAFASERIYGAVLAGLSLIKGQKKKKVRGRIAMGDLRIVNHGAQQVQFQLTRVYGPRVLHVTWIPAIIGGKIIRSIIYRSIERKIK